ncbi:hypothetical protein GC177_02205 [bacterium]|nr:hypothetical protein [bacterium]
MDFVTIDEDGRLFLLQCLTRAIAEMSAYVDEHGNPCPLHAAVPVHVNPEEGVAGADDACVYVVKDALYPSDFIADADRHAILFPIELVDLLTERQLTALFIHEARHDDRAQAEQQNEVEAINLRLEKLEALPAIARWPLFLYLEGLVDRSRRIVSSFEEDSDYAVFRLGYGDDLISALILIKAFVHQYCYDMPVDFDLLRPAETVRMLDAPPLPYQLLLQERMDARIQRLSVTGELEDSLSERCQRALEPHEKYYNTGGRMKLLARFEEERAAGHEAAETRR